MSCRRTRRRMTNTLFRYARHDSPLIPRIITNYHARKVNSKVKVRIPEGLVGDEILLMYTVRLDTCVTSHAVKSIASG